MSCNGVLQSAARPRRLGAAPPRRPVRMAVLIPAEACAVPVPEAARASSADVRLLCRLAALLAARHQRCSLEAVLQAPTRAAPVAAARQLAMYLAHVALGLPQTQVAQGFARHRRTVSHACGRVEDRRDDALFDAEVCAIEHQIRWAAGR